MRNMVEWTTERLPKELSLRISKIMEKSGYSSKSDFITEAVRKLLDEYEKSQYEHTNFHNNIIRLIDNHKPRGTPFVEIFLNDEGLHCETCVSKACEHIEFVWTEPKIKRELKKKGLKPI